MRQQLRLWIAILVIVLIFGGMYAQDLTLDPEIKFALQAVVKLRASKLGIDPNPPAGSLLGDPFSLTPDPTPGGQSDNVALGTGVVVNSSEGIIFTARHFLLETLYIKPESPESDAEFLRRVCMEPNPAEEIPCIGGMINLSVSVFFNPDGEEEPQEKNYKAVPTFCSDHREVDFAVLKIIETGSGAPFNPETANLPAVTQWTSEASLSDKLVIAGYRKDFVIRQDYEIRINKLDAITFTKISTDRRFMIYTTPDAVYKGMSGGLIVDANGSFFGMPYNAEVDSGEKFAFARILSLAVICDVEKAKCDEYGLSMSGTPAISPTSTPAPITPNPTIPVGPITPVAVPVRPLESDVLLLFRHDDWLLIRYPTATIPQDLAFLVPPRRSVINDFKLPPRPGVCFIYYVAGAPTIGQDSSCYFTASPHTIQVSERFWLGTLTVLDGASLIKTCVAYVDVAAEEKGCEVPLNP